MGKLRIRLGLIVAILGLYTGNLPTQARQSTTLADDSSYEQQLVAHSLSQIAPLTTSSVITGTWNTTLQNNLQIPGTISKLYVDENDRLYVTGGFNYLNGQEVNGLASWNGTAWQGYGLQPNDSGAIYTLTSYHDQLIVGGAFRQFAGQTMNGIARWNGTAFESFGTGFRGTSDFYDYSNIPKVHDLDVVSDTLYVSGNFSQFNDLVVNSLLAWQPTGYRKVANIDSSLYQFAATDEAVVVSGEVLSIDQTAIDYFARWQQGVWNNLPVPEYVYPAQETHVLSNTFYIRQPIYDQGAKTKIYHWAANTWVADPSLITGSARDLVEFDQQLYAATNTQLWQRSNAGWNSVNLPMEIASISAIEASSNGIYLAGSFTLNGQASQLVFWDGNNLTNLATATTHRWVSDLADLQNQPLIIDSSWQAAHWNGSNWHDLRKVPYFAKLLTTQDAQTYLVGSSPFTTTSNLASAIWQFEPTGSLNAPVMLDGFNLTWAISGTDVLASLYSGTINNQAISGTVAINHDQWRPFIPSYTNGNVYRAGEHIYSLRIDGDRGSWLIEISFWNGTSWQYLTAWQQFDQRPNVQITVWNNELYLLYNNELRRLDFDSASLITVASFDDVPLALRSTADYLYVAGKFNQVNNQAIGPLARWDGTTWQGTANTPNGSIYKLAVTAEHIHIAGSFTHVGTTPSLGIASFAINDVPASPSYRQFIPQASK
ncbi:hypothetical protein [Herpetosiphon llansteffanensis]|uniref:hypothetical protein n=1 Tax=Herpetosiphon llansteffanensis TaxID=2094568 RepID=UPI000D7C54BD|nr:hypothetical protein [Herpetosiphon llansteffanensis]